MIIHSTILNTSAKVIKIYGGTTWISHSGYMLRGATSGVTANSATKTGGSDDAIVVAHSHQLRPVNEARVVSGHAQFGTTGNTYYCVNNTWQTAIDFGYTAPEGSSGTNANIPNYKSVYIWERTA